MIKKVTGLRDSHARVIASKSIARTSISFKDLPLLYVMIGGGHFVIAEPLLVICLSGFRCYPRVIFRV